MESFYQIMRKINWLKNRGIKTLNKEDVEMQFGRDTDHEMKEILVYLDCKVVKVADLFNVTLPERKFTREEMNRQKRIEEMYNF